MRQTDDSTGLQTKKPSKNLFVPMVHHEIINIADYIY